VAVAGLLLERHGVLTREGVRGEGVPGGFAGVYPVLRAMEESGRIRRGYFVAGMGGAQFALPGAVDRLRAAREPIVPPPGVGVSSGVSSDVDAGAGDDVAWAAALPAGRTTTHHLGPGGGGRFGPSGDLPGPRRDPGPAAAGVDGTVMVLAATDPANAYGLGLPWPQKGPSRVPGAYVVLVDGQLSLYVERGGKGLVALRDFDDTWEERAVGALSALVLAGRWHRLALQRYPPELEGVLKTAEFTPTPKGLIRYGA
jgi:ATP-dependent Lhr-like helicase